MLEERRSDKIKNGSSFSSLFARELAYVIERKSLGSEEDARTILKLHLEGSLSLPLAVAYAERNVTYSTMLWDILVSHCLKTKSSSVDSSAAEGSLLSATDGSLFQSLLEAAAQCGADLAHLVSQIPEGMQIEGLRPMLLAAVADYRLKLKMHEASADIMSTDKLSLLREIAHRSRKGLRAFSVWDENDNTKGRPLLMTSSTNVSGSALDKPQRKIKNHRVRLQSERQARLRPISLLPSW